MVAAGDVEVSISQFSVVRAEAVNGRRLDLLLRSNMGESVCVLGTSVARLWRWRWSLKYCRVRWQGKGTGIGSVGVDEEAVVAMAGTFSSCFHVVVVQ